jgi:hypothetical protein
MSKEKSPSFQFYPRDWLSDSKLLILHPTQEGWYIRLICHCWMDGSIPADPVECLKLVGLRQAELENLSPEDIADELEYRKKMMQELLNLCFIAERSPSDDLRSVCDRLVQKRLDNERQNQEKNRKIRSIAGQKGNEKRWGKPDKKKGLIAIGSPSDDFAIAKNRLSTSTSTSTSTSKDITTPAPKRALCECGRVCSLGHLDENECNEKFDYFWREYPRHDPPRKATRKTWCKMFRSPDTDFDGFFEYISEAKKRWVDPQFIPMPTTFLNSQRWLGDLPPEQKKNGNGQDLKAKADLQIGAYDPDAWPDEEPSAEVLENRRLFAEMVNGAVKKIGNIK